MIILCGGKTGGHIIPLIAISKKINDVIYIGNKNSLEEKICKENNILFFGLETKNNVYSIIKNNFKIKFNHIDCIISTGGFISMPVLIYGILHKIPIYLIEGNTTFGITNKFFSYFSNKVFLAYPCKKMKKKYVITGLPTLINSNIYEHFDFDILIIGGSLGSKPLCDLIYSLNENFKIILIAGRYYKDYQNIKNVKAFEYRNDLNSLMKQAKIIISRAGAMTTYEIFLLNKVSIIIPSKNTTQFVESLENSNFQRFLCFFPFSSLKIPMNCCKMNCEKLGFTGCPVIYTWQLCLFVTGDFEWFTSVSANFLSPMNKSHLNI